jgi:hypothetical protein
MRTVVSTRVVRPEPELKDWEKAGWTRAPRNGHEKQMLREGKPQPKPAVPSKYKVCKHHGRTLFKTVMHWDGRRNKYYETSYCMKCKNASNESWRSRHPAETKVMRDDYQRQVKDAAADFGMDGVATVSSNWVLKHQADIVDGVKEGKHFIVEYFGNVAYRIGPVEG